MLSREDILKIADNAKLIITDEEIEKTTKEINKLVDMMSLIGELDMTDVEPLFYPNEQKYTFRNQDLALQTPRDALLENTKEAAKGMFKFPSLFIKGDATDEK